MGKKHYFGNETKKSRSMKRWENAYWKSEERVYAAMEIFNALISPKGVKVSDLTIEEWNRVYDTTKANMKALGIRLVPTPPTLRDLDKTK